MEFLCILQPWRGLVPPGVVRSSHLFSYGRGGGLRAETFCAMFSIGKGKGRARSLGNKDWRMWTKSLYFTFFCYCVVLVWWWHVITFLSFCYCAKLYTVKLFCYCLSGDKTTYYVDEIWQCLAINVRWNPLVFEQCLLYIILNGTLG